MKKIYVILLSIAVSLLIPLIPTAYGAFCCRDCGISTDKCWDSGICCDACHYVGCNCSDDSLGGLLIPICDGELKCPIDAGGGYFHTPNHVFYCNCTSYTECHWEELFSVFSAKITDFELLKPDNDPPTIGPNGIIEFNVTVENDGILDWTNDHAFVVVNYTKRGEITEHTLCTNATNQASGETKSIVCGNDTIHEPGIYDFVAYVIYEGLEETSVLDGPTNPIAVKTIKVEIEIEFLGLETGMALPCEPPELCGANYTRGQPLEFAARAKYWVTPWKYVYCNGLVESPDYCTASFSIDFGEFNGLDWTANDRWEESYNTKGLICDIHNLSVRVSKSGVESKVTKNFSISCTPRLTVVPNIVRSSLGQKNKVIFNVTIWNPTDEDKTFDLEMSSKDDFIRNYLYFISPNAADCIPPETCIQKIEDMFVSNISKIGYNSTPVRLSKAARVGNYETSFTATDQENGETYNAKGMIMIYGEGMHEFSLFWFFVLMISATFLYARFGKDKNRRA